MFGRLRRIGGRRVLGLLTGLAITVLMGSASGDPVVPDAPQCGSTDAGQIYIAIARDVFRLPYAAVRQIRTLPPIDDKTLVPDPPNSLAPPGCYANPVRARSLRLNLDIQAVLPAAGLPNAPIPIFGMAFMSSPISRETLQQDWFGAFCATETSSVIADVTPEGYERCAVRTGQPPPHDMKTIYKIPPTLYATPAGEPFFIRTHIGDLLYGGDSIIDYQLDDEVMLYYQFWLKDLPIEHVLDFDRALRAMIEAATVKDYPWPTN